MGISLDAKSGGWPAQGRHYARLARGYVVSRRLAGYWLLMLVLLGMIAWGGEWGRSHAPTTLRMLVFLLPVATSSVIGVSLWSPFGETERSAGTWLPLGRALHLASMLALALLVNRVAVASWLPEGDAISWGAFLLRHTLLLTGIALLVSLAIDTRLGWIVPALVAMPGLVMGSIRVEQEQIEGREAAFFHESWHPMLRPDGDWFAAIFALGVFAVGTLTVIRRGERPAEPDDAAG
jgi:hypothetical protein